MTKIFYSMSKNLAISFDRNFGSLKINTLIYLYPQSAAANIPYPDANKCRRQSKPPKLCRQHQRQYDYKSGNYGKAAKKTMPPFSHKTALPADVFVTFYVEGGNNMYVFYLVSQGLCWALSSYSR